MRTRLVHFKEDNIDILSNLHGEYCEGGYQARVERLKRVLSKSLTGVLTDTQRYCITEFYINRKKQKDIANDFVNRVKDIPEVAECYNISGDFDYLLKIYAPDMQYYNNFLINTLGTIDSLGSVQSSFVMSEIKNSCGLPL